MTHTWLGSPARRTLWRTSEDTAICLGYIKPDGTGWAVYVATDPGPNVPTTPTLLPRAGDAEAAARTMCAYWRAPYVALEPSERESDV